MAKGKPTIDDVAKLAEVGRTTVSRVINKGPHVRAEIRERVLQAVGTLGYRVNHQARHLAMGGGRQMLLVHASSLDTEPNSYYHSGLELGASRACSMLGLMLTTQAVDPDNPGHRERLLDFVVDRGCDGIILTPPLCDDSALVAAIEKQGVPVVLISPGPATRELVPSIRIDDRAAGAELARHLLSLGHSQFAFIQGITGHLSAESRFDGFCEALALAGADPEAVVVARGNFTFRSGINCAQEVLTGKRPVSALVCANDDMAAGALLTAHKLDIDVPGRLSVTGFDDTPVSEIVWPPLTTVHQPLRKMGAVAVETLAKAGSDDQGTSPDEIIPYRLVARESTAAAPDSDWESAAPEGHALRKT